MLIRRCPLCGEDNSAGGRTVIARDGYVVKACAVCGFVYLENAPSYEDLKREHAWETSFAREQKRRKAQYPILQAIDTATRFRLNLFPRFEVVDMVRNSAGGGNVLDVGCGSGDQLLALAGPFTIFGVEISEQLAAAADARMRPLGGYCVRDDAATGIARFPEGFFAAVSMRSYLEHEIAPEAVLTSVVRALSPGGIAVIKVPNYGSINAKVMGERWCGIRLPDHVNYFTPETLRRMVTKVGLEVRRFDPFRYRQPTADNMWMIAAKPAAAIRPPALP